MKRSLLPLAFFLAVAAAHADLVIEQKIESAIQSGPMTMKIKGDKVRVDFTAGPTGALSSIVDLTSADTINLLHAGKTAMRIPGAQTKQLVEMMKKQLSGGGDAAGNAAPAPPKATGKKEKVEEFNAEIYTWTGPTGTQTLWVSKDVPNYEKVKVQLDKLNKSPIIGMAKGMSPDTSALPGVVVKTEGEMAGQKFVTTIVSVKEEPVDAALFEIPKDYKEMTQPTLPGPAAVPPATPPVPAPPPPKAPAPPATKK